MRTGMGNLLETDSDVASISDNEKERTEGDGMESDALLDTNKNVSPGAQQQTISASSSDGSNLSTVQSVERLPVTGNVNDEISPERGFSHSLSSTSNRDASPIPSTSKNVTTSPRELPPRSQLIQLKPTNILKPKQSSKNSTETISDGINKQKNPRFVPYEPYRGAVRPIVAQDDPSKNHSRTASDASISSLTLEETMNSISIGGHKLVTKQLSQSQGLGSKKNTHEKIAEERKVKVDNTLQAKKQDQIIEKQTNAVTLLKERLKIAEKDNNDLHKENTRLKKLLVDSLSGDLVSGRVDHLNNSTMHSGSNHESVDALSNEIEVWRSKFLSSCVLVDQLTRENSALHDAVGSAANILKEIKLASTLSPEHFEEVNSWLRQNRDIPPSNSGISGNDVT